MRSSLFPIALLALALPTLFAACGGGPKPLSAAAQRGRDVFLHSAQPACGMCHKLNDAGTKGPTGPDLDKLRPTKEVVYRSVVQGVGVMPKQGAILTDGQMQDVAAYVAEVAGRRP